MTYEQLYISIATLVCIYGVAHRLQYLVHWFCLSDISLHLFSFRTREGLLRAAVSLRDIRLAYIKWSDAMLQVLLMELHLIVNIMPLPPSMD